MSNEKHILWEEGCEQAFVCSSLSEAQSIVNRQPSGKVWHCVSLQSMQKLVLNSTRGSTRVVSNW